MDNFSKYSASSGLENNSLSLDASDIKYESDTASGFSGSASSTIVPNAAINCKEANPDSASDSENYAKKSGNTSFDIEPTENKIWAGHKQLPKEDLCSIFERHYMNFLHTDIVIVIGTSTFKCHRCLLYNYSSYFVEKKDLSVVELPENMVSAETFERLYNWIIQKQPVLQQDGLVALLKAAKFLNINELENSIWYIFASIDLYKEAQAFMAFIEAIEFDIPVLKQTMLARICTFFLNAVGTKEFVDLNLTDVCDLLKSDFIGVHTEIEVFLAAVRWLRYNWEERSEYIPEIMSCVRFGLIPPFYALHYFQDIKCSELTMITSHPEVSEMIQRGFFYATTYVSFGRNKKILDVMLKDMEKEKQKERVWLFDEACCYHHFMLCPIMQTLTFDQFTDFLGNLRENGKYYYQTVKVYTGNETKIESCCDNGSYCFKVLEDKENV